MPRRLSPIGLPVVSSPEPEVPLYTGDMVADLQVVARRRLAETITGGLSLTSKMPAPSWGIPATRCLVGGALATQPGTVCHECYARKGRYRFTAVQAKLEERYRGLFHPLWTPAMVFLVRYFCDRYVRLFDSGDVQGENHLRNIITVARNVPDVQFWLPTREYATVRACADDLPPNLLVRVSAQRVDAPPPAWWPTTSTVVTAAGPGEGVCPAPEQGNRCGGCRLCWNPNAGNVTYRRH